jgi:hypothetical protein
MTIKWVFRIHGAFWLAFARIFYSARVIDNFAQFAWCDFVDV